MESKSSFCKKIAFLLFRQLGDFNLRQSQTKILLTPRTQVPYTNKAYISRYTKEIAPFRVLYFQYAVLKKAKANFGVDFAPFCNLSPVLLS